jgi:hypothetical protein
MDRKTHLTKAKERHIWKQALQEEKQKETCAGKTKNEMKEKLK